MMPNRLLTNPAVPPSGEKALTLALSLAQAEKAIHRFTAGQVDAIVDSEGHTYLLRPAQEHLRDEERRLRTILNSSGDGITVVNRDGLIVSQNRTATRMLGYATGELIGRSFFELVEAGEMYQFHSAFFNVIEDFRADAVVDFHLLSRDGSYRAIEATASKLRDSLQMCVVLTCRDVTIRRPAHAESMRREVELAGSLLDRDRFLAVLSHELRVPLSPIRLGLDELDELNALDGVALCPDVQSTLQMIRRNLDLQSHLLDDLIDFTTLGQHKVRLRLEAIDAHEAIRLVLEICRSELTAARIEVQLDLQAAESVVLADPVRLKQVMWNLLKNAVKFSSPGSRISIVTAELATGWLTIEVTDQGIGIESALLPFVFDSFRQSNLASARGIDGLGLGLFIAKGMAEAQGGTLTVLSEGRDKGATFRFLLPITRLTPITVLQSPSI